MRQLKKIYETISNREVIETQISLKAARINAGLTQQQVEKSTGFARSTLYRWENGKGFPRIDNLTTLCNLYGVPVQCIKKK